MEPASPKAAYHIHIDVPTSLPDIRAFRVVILGARGGAQPGAVYRGEGLTVEDVLRSEVDHYREEERTRIDDGESVDEILETWGSRVMERFDGRVEGLILFEANSGVCTFRFIRPGQGGIAIAGGRPE